MSGDAPPALVRRVVFLAQSVQEHRSLLPLFNAARSQISCEYRVTDNALANLVPHDHLSHPVLRRYFAWPDETTVVSVRAPYASLRDLGTDTAVVLGRIAATAQCRGPVVHWPHGFLSANPAAPLQEWMSARRAVGLVGCGGPADRAALARRGWNTSGLFLCGLSSAAVGTEMALDARNRAGHGVLVALQAVPRAGRLALLTLADALAADGLRVTVRRHPSDTGVDVSSAPGLRSKDRVQVSDPLTEDFLDAALRHEVVVAEWSTGLVEAAALGRCVVVCREESQPALLGEHLASVSPAELQRALLDRATLPDAASDLLVERHMPMSVNQMVVLLLNLVGGSS